MKTLKESTTFSTESGNLVAPYLNYADAEDLNARGTFEEKRFVHDMEYLFEDDKLNDKSLPLLVWWLKNSRAVYLRTSKEDKVERDHYALIVETPDAKPFTTEYAEGEGNRLLKKKNFDGSAETTRSPSLVSMLYCLLSDASFAEDCPDFEDFCLELGYTEIKDYKKAKEAFEGCRNARKALNKMFSHEEIETLKETFEDY